MRGEFFRIDPLAWKKACGLSHQAMTAYLILCRGTGVDHTTTGWSSNAIRDRAGMRHEAARSALRTLFDAELVQPEPNVSRSKPRYRLAQIGHGDDEFEPPWIWIPNTFVDGAGNETPPLKRLAQLGSHKTLATLVSLYGAHSLVECHGVDAGLLRCDVEARSLGTFGKWQSIAYEPRESVPKFNPHHSYSKYLPTVDDAELFEALELAYELGLGCWELILFRGDAETGEVIHPLTDQLILAAKEAVPDRHIDEFVLPFPRHELPALACVFRLHYLPSTRPTGEWLEQCKTQVRHWLDHYETIMEDVAIGRLHAETG